MRSCRDALKPKGGSGRGQRSRPLIDQAPSGFFSGYLNPKDALNDRLAKALERLDRHFDLAAVFGLGQQEPGDEGTERHREAARRGGQAVAQHHQETGGHEEFGALRLGHEMKERPQRNTPEDDQRSERQRGWNEGAEKRPAEPALAPARDGAGRVERARPWWRF